MNARLAVFGLLALQLVFACVGCPGPKGSRPPAGGKAISATDDRGDLVKLDRPAERIVSLSPAATETLFAIGVGDKVVGVTTFCDYPPEAKQVEKMGGYLDPNVEKTAAADPDLIVVQRGTSSEVLTALNNVGAATFVLDPRSYDNVVDGIERLGVLTGAPGTESVVGRMRRVVTGVRSRLVQIPQSERPPVLLGDPHLADSSGFWLPGADTLHHDLLVRAGGRNIAEDVTGGWQAFSLEVVLKREPQVVVATCKANEDPKKKCSDVLRRLRAMPGWKTVPAVRNERVYVIEENALLRPGPRLADALWTLAHFLHPKQFPEETPP